MLTRSKKNKQITPQRLTPVVKLQRCDSFADCVRLSGDRDQRVIASSAERIIENTDTRAPLDSKFLHRLEALKKDLNSNGSIDGKSDRRVSFRLEPPTRVYQKQVSAESVPKKKTMTAINPSDVSKFFGFDDNDDDRKQVPVANNQEKSDLNSVWSTDSAGNNENELFTEDDGRDATDDMPEALDMSPTHDPSDRVYARSRKIQWNPEFDQSLQLTRSPVFYTAMFGFVMAVLCYFIFKYTEMLRV